MKKQLVSLAVAALFLAGSVGVSMATTVKCEVKAVDGPTVTLECGKKATKLTVGETVKVKPKKATQAIEGC